MVEEQERIIAQRLQAALNLLNGLGTFLWVVEWKTKTCFALSHRGTSNAIGTGHDEIVDTKMELP